MSEEQAAEVLNQDGPEQETEPTEVAKADDAGESVEHEGDVEEPRKRLGGWQRKIRKLEEQNEKLIALLTEKSGGAKGAEPTKQEENKAPVKPEYPDEDKFATWEEFRKAERKYHADMAKYVEDLADYKADQKIKQTKAEEEKKSETKKVQDGFAAQVAEAKKSYADFDEVAFSEDVPMSNAMMEAIVTSDLGAEVAYYLGKNPELAEEIAQMSPIKAVREIGKIEARIAGEKSEAVEEKEEKKAEEKPKPPVAKAPKPPTPVKKPSPTAPKNLYDDTMSVDEWMKERNKQVYGR